MDQKKKNSEHDVTGSTFVDESDEELVFLDDLPPIENDLWKWVVLFVSSAQSMVIQGIIASAGVYMEPMKEAYRLDSFAQIGATYSVSNIISSVLAPLSGFCIDSFGIRATSMVGLVAIGVALTSIGNFFIPSLLYLDFVILVLGKSIINSTCCVAIANYFEKKAGIALAISTCGKCLGGSAFPLFMHYLFDNFGFSRGMTVIGIFAVVSSLSSIAYRPIVAIMEEKDTGDESGVGHRQSLARQSIVSIMSLDKCPTVITYLEDSCNRDYDKTVRSASCVTLAGRPNEVCTIRTKSHSVVGLTITPFGKEILESCEGDLEKRHRSMALVVQADAMKNYKQRFAYFMQKFALLKLVVKPDFLLFGISRIGLEICMELMYIYFPIFSTSLLGVQRETALWLRTCFAVSGTLGSFVAGFIIDKKFIEVNIFTAMSNCTVGILVFLFQYMPGLIPQACLICVSGMLLGSQSMANALILMKFYEKSVLASALAMTGNFRTVGSGIAPLLFTYLLDNSYDGIIVWGVGSIACLSSGMLIILASYLNNRSEH